MSEYRKHLVGAILAGRERKFVHLLNQLIQYADQGANSVSIRFENEAEAQRVEERLKAEEIPISSIQKASAGQFMIRVDFNQLVKEYFEDSKNFPTDSSSDSDGVSEVWFDTETNNTEIDSDDESYTSEIESEDDSELNSGDDFEDDSDQDLEFNTHLMIKTTF